MALFKCIDCKKKISNKASKCPNCGSPVNKFIIEKSLKLEEENINNKIATFMFSLIIIAGIIILITISQFIFYIVINEINKSEQKDYIEYLETEYQKESHLLEILYKENKIIDFYTNSEFIYQIEKDDLEEQKEYINDLKDDLEEYKYQKVSKILHPDGPIYIDRLDKFEERANFPIEAFIRSAEKDEEFKNKYINEYNELIEKVKLDYDGKTVSYYRYYLHTIDECKYNIKCIDKEYDINYPNKNYSSIYYTDGKQINSNDINKNNNHIIKKHKTTKIII